MYRATYSKVCSVGWGSFPYRKRKLPSFVS